MRGERAEVDWPRLVIAVVAGIGLVSLVAVFLPQWALPLLALLALPPLIWWDVRLRRGADREPPGD